VRIVADQNIPRVADAFADLGEVELLPGREIRRDRLRDCRCLLVRTVTRIDAALLDGTAVEFVGTATIGTDHIDLDYLASAGIACSNAAGCNAEAAAEYVVSGLFALSARKGFDPFGLRAGIVGHGNVGKRLRQKLEILGIDYRICDPPLAAAAALPGTGPPRGETSSEPPLFWKTTSWVGLSRRPSSRPGSRWTRRLTGLSLRSSRPSTLTLELATIGGVGKKSSGTAQRRDHAGVATHPERVPVYLRLGEPVPGREIFLVEGLGIQNHCRTTDTLAIDLHVVERNPPVEGRFEMSHAETCVGLICRDARYVQVEPSEEVVRVSRLRTAFETSGNVRQGQGLKCPSRRDASQEVLPVGAAVV